VPIPIAFVFESFRKNRFRFVLKDRIKQKEALLACYISLDNNKKNIDFRLFS